VSDGPGCFIVFEGIEGAGKSTQLHHLARELERRGHAVVATLEPGGTPLGRHLRGLVMEPREDPPTPMTELLLYLADRAQHLDQVIRPALARGAVVLCDRFSGSTLAYQGHGRGLDLERVVALDAAVRQGLEPDLTLLLDCDVESGLARATGDDRMQREKLTFHRRVQEGFHSLAAGDPRWKTVSTEAPADEVTRAILAAAETVLPPCPSRKS
jgi:dTMP kinase